MADVLKMAKTIASECVAHRARQVARVLTRAYDESIRSLGIQISQLILLVAIADAGDEGAPIGQIGKRGHCRWQFRYRHTSDGKFLRSAEMPDGLAWIL